MNYNNNNNFMKNFLFKNYIMKFIEVNFKILINEKLIEYKYSNLKKSCY